MENKRYIYIAAPYTNPDPVINTGDAIRAAEILVSAGYIPFIPHLTLFWHFLSPHEIDFWYRYDMAWLAKCDCILRIPGESPGADKEVHWAKKLNMPVYYSVQEALEAINK